MGNQLKLTFFKNLSNNDINVCFNYPQKWAIPENIQNKIRMALEILYKFWLSSKIFSGGGGSAAKNFLGGTPSKFSETNDSWGGQSFLSKMKFSHKSHNYHNLDFPIIFCN